MVTVEWWRYALLAGSGSPLCALSEVLVHLDARAAAGGGMLRGYRAGALQWEIHYDDAGRAPPTAGSVRRLSTE